MPPMKEEYLNYDGGTPRELFTESHRDLAIQGVYWTKETASSCSVIIALVATITFVAAFTIPGGYDQNKDCQSSCTKSYLCSS